jgi:hypothetical protein
MQSRLEESSKPREEEKVDPNMVEEREEHIQRAAEIRERMHDAEQVDFIPHRTLTLSLLSRWTQTQTLDY